MRATMNGRRMAAAGMGALALAAGVVAVAEAKGTQTLRTRADAHGALKYTVKRLHAHAGVVKIVMTNPRGSGLPHGIAVEGHGVDKDGKVVRAGGTSTVTVRLKKGTYEFYCPIPAHKKAGMEGRLIVS
jgi:plastocyanin